MRERFLPRVEPPLILSAANALSIETFALENETCAEDSDTKRAVRLDWEMDTLDHWL